MASFDFKNIVGKKMALEQVLVVFVFGALLAFPFRGEAQTVRSLLRGERRSSLTCDVPGAVENFLNRDNRFIIGYDKKCRVDADMAEVLAKMGNINLDDEDFEEDESDFHRTGKEVLPKGSIFSGNVIFESGFFQEVIYNEVEWGEFEATPFGKARRELLRAIATLLGAKLGGRRTKEMTPADKLKILEDQEVPTLTCKYLKSLDYEYCSLPDLKTGLAHLQRTTNTTIETSFEVIPAALREIGKKHFSGEKQRAILRAVECIRSVEIDTSSSTHPVEEQVRWHHQEDSIEGGAVALWERLGSGRKSGRDGITVAVIDGGCARREDLYRDNEETPFWRNRGEVNCSDGIDDDGNGYADDCWGWNFAEDNCHSEYDGDGGGSDISASIGSLSSDYSGSYGMRQSGKIMCLKAAATSARHGVVRASDALEALNYAIENGAEVSNLSHGTYGYGKAMYEAIRVAAGLGHLVVSAAGNSDCAADSSTEPCLRRSREMFKISQRPSDESGRGVSEDGLGGRSEEHRGFWEDGVHGHADPKNGKHRVYRGSDCDYGRKDGRRSLGHFGGYGVFGISSCESPHTTTTTTTTSPTTISRAGRFWLSMKCAFGGCLGWRDCAGLAERGEARIDINLGPEDGC